MAVAYVLSVKLTPKYSEEKTPIGIFLTEEDAKIGAVQALQTDKFLTDEYDEYIKAYEKAHVKPESFEVFIRDDYSIKELPVCYIPTKVREP